MGRLHFPRIARDLVVESLQTRADTAEPHHMELRAIVRACPFSKHVFVPFTVLLDFTALNYEGTHLKEILPCPLFFALAFLPVIGRLAIFFPWYHTNTALSLLFHFCLRHFFSTRERRDVGC